VTGDPPAGRDATPTPPGHLGTAEQALTQPKEGPSFVDTMEHEVWLDADRESVFAALTTRDGLDGWWGKAVIAEPRGWHVRRVRSRAGCAPADADHRPCSQ
jgi:hypothetical protein